MKKSFIVVLAVIAGLAGLAIGIAAGTSRRANVPSAPLSRTHKVAVPAVVNVKDKPTEQPSPPKDSPEDPQTNQMRVVRFASNPQQAPAFLVRAIDGSVVSTAEWHGKVVLLNFWATWCGPCQQEMPLLDQMYRKYKPAGFTLIGVNVDKDAPPVKELLARKPVSFPVLLDPANQVSKAYHVDEMPSSVIIDRKGEIRYIHRGYRPGDENEYQDRIRQLIRE